MEYIKLGDVIESAKCRRSGEAEYPVLSITKSDGIVLQSEKFKKRIASQDTSQYKVVSRGQLVQGIHIDEANFGIQDIVNEGIVSPAYKIWNVNSSIIKGQYLAELLRSPRSIQYYSSYFNGSVKRRERLSDKDFLAMNIPCPSLTEQEHVLNVISKSREVITYRQQELEKLDDLIKARFVEMFGDSEYESVLLIDTIKHGVGLSYGIVVPGDNVDDGVPMIRPSDFSNGILDLTNVYRVSKEIECKYVKTRLAGDEILVQVIGQPGQVMLATDECKGMNVTRNLAVIRPNHKMVNRLYLKQYMEKGESQQFLLKNTKQSTLKQLPLNLLKQLEVQLPPIELQNQFADFVTQVDKSKVIKQYNQLFS